MIFNKYVQAIVLAAFVSGAYAQDYLVTLNADSNSDTVGFEINSNDDLGRNPLVVHLDKSNLSPEMLEKLGSVPNIVFADLPDLPQFVNLREYISKDDNGLQELLKGIVPESKNIDWNNVQNNQKYQELEGVFNEFLNDSVDSNKMKWRKKKYESSESSDYEPTYTSKYKPSYSSEYETSKSTHYPTSHSSPHTKEKSSSTTYPHSSSKESSTSRHSSNVNPTSHTSESYHSDKTHTTTSHVTTTHVSTEEKKTTEQKTITTAHTTKVPVTKTTEKETTLTKSITKNGTTKEIVVTTKVPVTTTYKSISTIHEQSNNTLTKTTTSCPEKSSSTGEVISKTKKSTTATPTMINYPQPSIAINGNITNITGGGEEFNNSNSYFNLSISFLIASVIVSLFVAIP
ncbi:hypothetical protein TPHA_0F03200 [Tetrapisispora phaffii CBS 4417]|uniref:Uncharacterized protein n=1 Tax=Tetrapisispora phaffii (strain ATCC 24235 / CBS 4417 / NBRC 1672 / NRRL Y-8282 / UCD 70-5) TaxID=1071381 RepID=G8BUL5_TETPH|nr:hypothetical protein TPHA_0F03200 [Tetrapisispora phaffii CBS 4417]CCE63801.1 hypothetical protein TPHA_0F03200 [Tetrapisispora phaffii CBS 4417]